MTDSQFDLFLIHGGMMAEGLKSEEALAFIVRSQLANCRRCCLAGRAQSHERSCSKSCKGEVTWLEERK